LLYRNLPPNQGGRYVGFGSTPMPVANTNANSGWDMALSSLSTVSIITCVCV